LEALDVRVPPAEIDGHQADAGLHQPPGEQDALTPGRGATAVGRLGVERRHEAVALADRGRLLVEVEGVPGGARREDVPRLLVEAVEGVHLAVGVHGPAYAVEVAEQRPAVADAL